MILLVLRCTSGPPALLCQPARRASSRCPPSPSGLQTTSTSPRPTPASHVSTCHSILQNRYSNRNSCQPLRPRILVLCRGSTEKSLKKRKKRKTCLLLCNIYLAPFLQIYFLSKQFYEIDILSLSPQAIIFVCVVNTNSLLFLFQFLLFFLLC